jgi:hypothetical protein
MSDNTEELREKLGYALAMHFSGNRMPHMSGDPRNRLSPSQRRNMEDAITSILEVIGPVEAETLITKTKREALRQLARHRDLRAVLGEKK